MKRVYSLKYAWLVYLFLLILVSSVEGNASAMIGAWEPFKTKIELGSYVVGVDADEIRSARDELIQTDKIIFMDQNPAVRKDDSSLNGLRIHNVTISFSRAMMDQMKVDIRQSTGNENEKLNAIKSLPSVFLNSSYRDAFESLGKIFEPQVNLSIEF
jgi:hypothetical protein